MHNSAVPHAVYNDVLSIRTTRPLIHNITNFVVMNTTANALLALGASPIMAHAIEELPELISISNVLVLNIGTLDKNWINNMAMASQLASEKNKPIVLDPVGAGASRLRTESVLNLLKSAKITVLRGNASEIMALDQQTSFSKGVDSTEKSERAIASAKNISKKFGCVVCVSGKTDYCISESNILTVKNGSPMMSCVTGMGCTATAIIGAFLAVNKNAFEACYHAMICMGMCGEVAALRSNGPGTFLPQFLDALYCIDVEAQ
ncbi:MAG: hydroxyethylthiazole kinase [Gammaproteobacteria bacterium RIFCSPHIGHO2_12_FULL_38_11]|nr:MAG: hydroxyethylthiazole kinase [Gammaproteobacteria bacterium RIFCSPHIGHO2_12_FULL_38_11]